MFIQPSSEERCRREREREVERGDEAPLSSIRPSSRGVACTIFSGPHRPCARARRPTDLDRWRSDLPRPRNLCADARRETHLLPPPSSTPSSANPSALSARPHSRRASLWHQPEQEEGIKTATWRLHARAGLALTQLRFQLWCRMPVASFWTAGGDGRNWFLVLVFL